MRECVQKMDALKHQIWYNLKKLLATCRGAVYRGSQRIFFIHVSIWSFVHRAGDHPELSMIQPTPTSSHAGARFQHISDTGLLTGNFSFPKADPRLAFLLMVKESFTSPGVHFKF